MLKLSLRMITVLLQGLCVSIVNADVIFYSPESTAGRAGHDGGYFFDTANLSHGPQQAITSIGNLAWLLQGMIAFAGVCMLFVSLNKYFDHRKNSQYAPMSTVLSPLAAGIALLVISFFQSDYL